MTDISCILYQTILFRVSFVNSTYRSINRELLKIIFFISLNVKYYNLIMSTNLRYSPHMIVAGRKNAAIAQRTLRAIFLSKNWTTHSAFSSTVRSIPVPAKPYSNIEVIPAITKELSLCYKLWFFHPYIFAANCRKP